MTAESIDRQTHWQKIYRTRTADSVSWYRPHLDVSIELLGLAGLSADSRVIDIGGGASTLVDDLLDRGVRDVSVLDVSDEALAIARKRLGDRAKEVNWYVADVLHAVIGGFAPDGPEWCSGLPVTRRSAEEIAGIFASTFSVLQIRKARHRTPAGTEKSFVYAPMLRS